MGAANEIERRTTPITASGGTLTERTAAVLQAHIARDGRSPETLAEAMWGPWSDGTERDRRRRLGGKRIRDAVKRGWIPDPDLVSALALALGVTERELLFGDAG